MLWFQITRNRLLPKDDFQTRIEGIFMTFTLKFSAGCFMLRKDITVHLMNNIEKI